MSRKPAPSEAPRRAPGWPARGLRHAALAGLSAAGATVLLAALPAPAAIAGRWTWSGAGSLDHQSVHRVNDPGTIAREGAIVEWSLKANVELSEKASVTARLCTSCHGLTVNQASAEIRFRPQLNLEAGRINVPFVDFHLRHDPASDAFMSKPLPYAMGHMLRYTQSQFNLGVIPMPYVDSGATLFGDVWIRDRLQIWYGLYGVNGFRSAVPQDFNFMDQVSDAGFTDNNDDLAWGGRLAIAQGPAAAGASYLRGAYDPKTGYDYEAWGIDGSIHLRGSRLRAEYLERRTEVLDAGGRGTLEKKGFYGQLETPLGPALALVGRLDGLLREGPRLGTDNDATSGIWRWTLGLNLTPAADYSLRAQYEHWRFTDFTDADVVHLGLIVTY